DPMPFRRRRRLLIRRSPPRPSIIAILGPSRNAIPLIDSLTESQLNAIRGVALDMWQPYIASIEEHLEYAGCKMVFDRFHVMQHLGRAVDNVRKQEHRALRAEGDDALLRTKYLWLHSQENLSDEQRVRLDGL